MSNQKRKIVRYALKVINNLSKETMPNSGINDCLKDIIASSKEERKIEDNVNHKFHFLEEYINDGVTSVGYFKSAKYHHKPPLINRITLDERDNPKDINEGESEKTHFGISFSDTDEAILLLESKSGGVSIGPFARYLERHITDDIHIDYDFFLTGSFLAKLQDMNRATAAEIYTTKEILSDTFGQHVRVAEVKEEIMLSLKANKKGGSIKNSIRELYIFFSSQNTQIKRLRVHGKTDTNDDLLLDTSRLADSEYISVEVDENGQVITESILPKIETMVKLLL